LYYSRGRNSGDVETAMYRNAGIVTTPTCLPTYQPLPLVLEQNSITTTMEILLKLTVCEEGGALRN
jgi:hypothetical protein